MKMIFRLRKHHYTARVSIFLIVLALIAGTVNCTGAGTKYDLTVTVAPQGSGNATDLTNDSPYATGTKIVIQAVAAAGHQFVHWSATAGTIANAKAAQTTFTMPAQDATLYARFVKVYSLTMAANPVGGGTATDLTNASPYPAGTKVSIEAVAAAGYQFINWSAPAGTFADANAARTTFTMPAQEVTVTADFARPLDDFTFYEVVSETYIGEVVYLEDQFGAVNATVEWAAALGNPAGKVHDDIVAPMSNPDHHLMVYSLAYEEEPQEWCVEVNNQFGTQQLVVSGPVGLAVPTQKAGHEPPVGLDHYLLYEVIEGPLVEEDVSLTDEFGENLAEYVYDPVLFASPVRKTHGNEVTEIVNPEVYAVIYSIGGVYFEEEAQVVNQFGEQTLQVYGPAGLAVPSEKRKLEPPEHPLAFAAVLGVYNCQLIGLLWANNISAEERDWDVIADIGDYDVVVVNEPDDPGSADFQAFLDAASDNGVGVVFTSSYPIDSSWGISLLERYSADPVGQSEDYDLGDVYYKVTQEHPIFNGWNVGDEITIITGGDRDHGWFWGYSGDTIAEVGSADSGIQGDAVAVGVYGGSKHVLLASLGPQGLTNVAHWTDDAETIFINAVRFAAGIP